jgi:hypothetical protein
VSEDLVASRMQKADENRSISQVAWLSIDGAELLNGDGRKGMNTRGRKHFMGLYCLYLVMERAI